MGKGKGKAKAKPTNLKSVVHNVKNMISYQHRVAPYIRTGKRMASAVQNAQSGRFSKSYKDLKRIHDSQDTKRIIKDAQFLVKTGKQAYRFYKKKDSKDLKLNKLKKFAKEWAKDGGLAGMAERALGIDSKGPMSQAFQLYMQTL